MGAVPRSGAGAEAAAPERPRAVVDAAVRRAPPEGGSHPRLVGRPRERGVHREGLHQAGGSCHADEGPPLRLDGAGAPGLGGDRARRPGEGPLRHPELLPGAPRGCRPRRWPLADPAS
eukprot:14624797-Alexandrium_andersonii.AAC.1